MEPGLRDVRRHKDLQRMAGHQRQWLALLLVTCMPAPVQAFTDPVTAINGYLMLILMVVALFLVVRYRDRVLFLITGDNQVHVDLNSSLWIFFCTCCRQCSGEWTKYVSYVCCFCCPTMRGRNLKRMLGQTVGVVPIPVQISNIVIGDLPMYTTQDLILSVEVGHMPAQITSTAEDARPKVVQFPDTLLIRVRRSVAEGSVRFCVKAVHAFGCTELCECYINPIILVQWSRMQRGPRRFRMDPIDRHRSDALFPPWLLIELNPMQEWGSSPLSEFNVRLTNTQTGAPEEDPNPATFKSKYNLLSTYGTRAEEPDEATYGRLDKMRQRRGACLTQSCFILWLVAVSFFCTRVYCFACYREYQIMHVLDSYQQECPVDKATKSHFMERCGLGGSVVMDLLAGVTQRTIETTADTLESSLNHSYSGSNTTSGEVNVSSQALLANVSLSPEKRSQLAAAIQAAIASGSLKPRMTESLAKELCDVSEDAVYGTCTKLPFGCTNPSLPINVMNQFTIALPCGKSTCSATDTLEPWDGPVMIFCIGLIIAMLIVGSVFDRVIGQMEDELRHGGHSVPDSVS